jgi:hypothetical protein
MSEWYYGRGEERIGPVSEEQLRSLLTTGEVSPEAMVWTQGLQTWLCAKDAPRLTGATTAAATPAIPVQALPAAAMPAAAAPVEYFTSAAGLPPRAAMNLRGHAAPQGDIGDWPLDDLQISQFEETLRLRKRVSSTANNYRALMVLGVILSAVFILVGIIQLSQGRPGSTSAALGVGAFAVVMLGISALYCVTWRATLRSQRWAPLTMFVFFLVGCLTSILGIAVGSTARLAGPPIFGGVFGLLIGGLFAASSWRAFTAIPRYLSQPAWCQELVVKAKL